MMTSEKLIVIGDSAQLGSPLSRVCNSHLEANAEIEHRDRVIGEIGMDNIKLRKEVEKYKKENKKFSGAL